MNTDHRNPRLRRGFAFVALAAVLGLTALGLSQCRMVDDTVTGVDVRSNDSYNGWWHGRSHGRSRCVHQCDERYKQCKRAEDARYKHALRDCGSNSTCKKNEKKKHDANQKECVRQMQLCKKNCRYHEGAGAVGR